MSTQYYCKNQNRKSAVKSTLDSSGNPKLNGIDYLEVISQDQKELNVHFLFNLPKPTEPVPSGQSTGLTIENIKIDGGVRIKNITVTKVESEDNILTVYVNEAGDFSLYTLSIVDTLNRNNPPAGFDPQLSSVAFSFKIDCPGNFDCKQKTECLPEQLPEPEINYLAKDYQTFKNLMLDRMSLIMPQWKERNAADLQITLVELLAYVGDQLSYFQDAVATEAYLGTARKRVSVKRHTRLLDYTLHNGCNARTWICAEVKNVDEQKEITLPQNTILLSSNKDSNNNITLLNKDNLEISGNPIVFETMHNTVLHSSHNKMFFYTWNDTECCLPVGSTEATIIRPEKNLENGEVLIFEEIISPTTLKKEDADPTHRQAVRLIEVTQCEDPLNDKQLLNIKWHDEDALLFPLCISAQGESDISVILGNVVLADHGITINDYNSDDDKILIPSFVPNSGYYHPILKYKDISFGTDYDHERAVSESASSQLKQNPQKAKPNNMILKANDESWLVQSDLLSSDRFKMEFVVEVENDGTTYLRFGDDILGKKPIHGTEFFTQYRVGNGSKGNIGADVLTYTNFPNISVRNPLPARGGTDPEDIETARKFAPEAFRSQRRAVTETDYVNVAESHQEVQKAIAAFRWTGSWHTVFLTIDRKGSFDVDEKFKTELREYIEEYRLAGYDIEIKKPVYVPLDISISICVKPGFIQSYVKESLINIFSRFDLGNGKRGFFHPDNFTFGQPLYLSSIYRTIMEINGISFITIQKFCRMGKDTVTEKDNDVIIAGAAEILRLDNDPNFPENGKIVFNMQGGV